MENSLGNPKPLKFKPMYVSGTLAYPLLAPVCGLQPVPLSMIGQYGLLPAMLNAAKCYNPDGVNTKTSSIVSTPKRPNILEAPGVVDSPSSHGRSPCSITSSTSRDSIEIETTEEDAIDSPESSESPEDEWVVIP